MIKLIAIDLDGTLFNSKSQISKENKKAILKCLGNNVKVVLTTGKTIYSVGKIIKELGLKDLQIASGGTVIIDKELRPLVAITIPREAFIKVVNLARDWNKGVTVSNLDGFIYYEKSHPNFKYITETGEIMVKVNNLLDESIIKNSLLFTITVDENDDFNSLLPQNLDEDVKIKRGGPFFLNVLHRDAGKVAAIKKVLETYNIDKENTMSIGDSDSDLGIIQFAGFGVAMGNSTNKIKSAAKAVVSDNDNDGVAEAIYKYVFAS